MRINKVSIIFDKNKLIIGIVLIFLGLIAPKFVNVHNFNAYDLLFKSIEKNDTGLLLLSASSLVILNCIRGLPHYLGTFIVAESIKLEYKDKKIPYVKGFIAIIIIPLVYSSINIIHNIKYDLSIPAFIVIFAIMFLEYMDISEVSILKKAIIIVLLLFGVQWLDIIPGLSMLRFGRGETSQDIKFVASLLNGEEILTIFGILFFVVFVFGSILVAKLVSDENRIIVATEKNKKIEQELHEYRMDSLQTRYYTEMKNLVHDLKTPLTSSIALISVIKMMDECSDSTIQEYLERIEASLDNQSEMISEILYKDKKITLTSEELFNYVLSNISHLPYASKVIYNNDARESLIDVNKVNFTRAMINILDNSFNALDNEDGHIWINIYSKEGKLYIDICDDGIGIKEELMKEIQKSGVSGRKSTGLGLTYIKDVIDNHNGQMYITSKYGVGTITKVILSEVI
ncbi:MAG: HAMP domain-containing sensor histidine kinase [Tissierellia bacterium]|nr:HAMP domain-containing sensor histidine kinase [Tissierellia bacterium]MDD4725941.1 HAMP domain-containing sensor histidine kinase [Tissierellia bacterium]